MEGKAYPGPYLLHDRRMMNHPPFLYLLVVFFANTVDDHIVGLEKQQRRFCTQLRESFDPFLIQPVRMLFDLACIWLMCSASITDCPVYASSILKVIVGIG